MLQRLKFGLRLLGAGLQPGGTSRQILETRIVGYQFRIAVEQRASSCKVEGEMNHLIRNWLTFVDERNIARLATFGRPVD
jgi:hypothetical protein